VIGPRLLAVTPLRCRQPQVPNVPAIATVVGATVGALCCYTVLLVALEGGLRRRVLLAACLLWIVGWIAVAPSVSTREETPSYLASTVAGGFLLGISILVYRLGPSGPDSSGFRTGWVPWELRSPRYLLLAGSAFAVPGAIGLLFGPELLVLVFVVTAAVAVILLFLFR